LRFPFALLRPLPKGSNIGRSNVRRVAERRRIDLKLFIDSLFEMADEVSQVVISNTFFYQLYVFQCEFVYTFFQTLHIDSTWAEQHNNAGTQ
jgi:hypothetical protein